MCVCTLPCKVVSFKIVTKHSVNSRYCWRKLVDWDENNFSLLEAHHSFTLLSESLKYSSLALAHTVRRWRHCCAAHAWWYGLWSPINKQSRILCILYWQCQFNSRNAYLRISFQSNSGFVLDLEWNYAESYVIFFTILFLVTLRGKVDTHAGWNR